MGGVDVGLLYVESRYVLPGDRCILEYYLQVDVAIPRGVLVDILVANRNVDYFPGGCFYLVVVVYNCIGCGGRVCVIIEIVFGCHRVVGNIDVLPERI